jgi:hypothetical protein
MLACACCKSPYWLTFKQAKEANGAVRKGEHGSMVVFAKRSSREVETDSGEMEERTFTVLRYYTIFNIEQTGGCQLNLPEQTVLREIPARVKYEVQQAANCLEYDAYSAVGFHVLRAVELIVLEYFTLPGWSRNDASTWTDYARELKKTDVHPKIRSMIVRLAELHRNELMHAEAVLDAAEAAMLFALMQEVAPIMIADIAKRRGTPIANFPILDNPRWQNRKP